MWNRRTFLTRGGLGLLGAAGLAAGLPGDGRGDPADAGDALPDGSAARGMVTPRAEQAIERGLAYLARARNWRDGSFGTNNLTGNVAVTSLGALAFMAGGAQPGRGPHGKIVSDALRFVLAQEKRDGVH